MCLQYSLESEEGDHESSNSHCDSWDLRHWPTEAVTFQGAYGYEANKYESE